MWQVRFSNDWTQGSSVNLLRVGFYRAPGDHCCIQLSLAGFSAYLHRWVFK